MNRFKYFMLVGLLAGLPIAEAGAQALDQDYQAISSGNNAWDAGTSLGVTGVRQVVMINTGSVAVQYAWSQADATANNPAGKLAAGQKATFKFESGYGPASVWLKGEGAVATVAVYVTNLRSTFEIDLAGATVPGVIKCRSFTIVDTDFTATAVSETETDPGGALPAGALGGPGARIEVTEAVVGPTIAAAVADCGFNGAGRGDLIADGINVFATGTDYGTGTNARPNSLREVGGLTLQCTFTATGDDIGDATAAEIEVTYCFFLPAAG